MLDFTADKKPAAVLIAGPTASGKSALAFSLALRHNGVVINTDSMQVYGDLRVLTARPPIEEEQRVPHYLFGHIDGAVNYSVGQWLEDVGRILPGIRASGRLPIFVGGTGLYFKALTQGLSDIPPVPDAIRMKVRAEAEGLSPALLHQKLATFDPVMAAKLRPSDPQRILRAIEVILATGQSLSVFQRQKKLPLLDLKICGSVFLSPDRDMLRTRIERRFSVMLEQGALNEVKRLGLRKLDARLPVMRAHGVPHILDHFSGKIDIETAVARAIMDTWHYARRQFTFARHQLDAFEKLSAENDTYI